jgi:hypothetical protein
LHQVLAWTETNWAWDAEDFGDHAALVCRYPANATNAQGAFIADEPWAEEGAAIIAAADLRYVDGGADAYIDQWGNEMVSQWTRVRQE